MCSAKALGTDAGVLLEYANQFDWRAKAAFGCDRLNLLGRLRQEQLRPLNPPAVDFLQNGVPNLDFEPALQPPQR